METITPFKRENSKSSFTDDDELSRMSDLESEYRDNNIRRMSLTSSLPASPSASSYNKMSVDSDDARSVSSTSRRDNHTMETSTLSPSTTSATSAATPSTVTTTTRAIRPIGSSWANLSSNNIRQQDELYMVDSNTMSKKAAHTKSSYDLRERRDPERRSVNRRSSLLVSFGLIKFFLKLNTHSNKPKSKALLRVIDQADEDTHLGDLEMRREHETTVQLKTLDDECAASAEKPQQGVPAASWTKVADLPLYQCSKLNPEIEMTSFQLENIASPSQQQQTYKSIKRKASEDRFEPYPTSIGLKRRAVSPSVSLNGSPILTGYSSPPTSFASYYGGNGGPGGTSPNAAARAQQKASSSSSFNLHDASGGLSRMSLSE
ncbi:hypothetical protein MAM1_0143c06457 [Mucor ambiguus]|uniref:Uncharacterized protein n=1 Tax=Mucor ambiguus TaxID=91626 RepID=A0A0C9MU74_9FUNG|nr:hypothetical protein MAM1_0143c06457 [Mucor ambiguus]